MGTFFYFSFETIIPNYAEEDIKNATQEVATGLAMRASAARHGIPELTPRSRLSGRQSRHKARNIAKSSQRHRGRTLLRGLWPKMIWASRPPIHAMVVNFTDRIARMNGNFEPIRTRRNPEVKTERIS
jgi:hypothetical protein